MTSRYTLRRALIPSLALLIAGTAFTGCASTGGRKAATAVSEGDPGTPVAPGVVVAAAAGPMSIAKKKKLSFHCGTERWAVKTLSDQDVSNIDFDHVVQTTITALNALAPDCGGSLPTDQRPRDEERKVYEVVGRVIVIKQEADRDYHIGLEDPTSHATMVVEVVDTRCPGARDAAPDQKSAMRAGHDSLFDALGDAGLDALNGQEVRVRGVGFFDKGHGQTGLSESCIELHPVISFELMP